MRFSSPSMALNEVERKFGVFLSHLARYSVGRTPVPYSQSSPAMCSNLLARQGGAGNLGGDSMKYLPIAFVICGLAANLSAGTIPILNPNFDAQVLAPGTASGSGASWNPITNWNQNDVVNTGYSVYNPVATSY